VALGAILLFAIVFMWTPPHFWALALYRSDDYQKAGVPMMPVVAGERETKKLILLYAALLAPLAVLPAATGMASWAYGAFAAALGLVFVGFAVGVWREREGHACARRTFAFSILYLFLIFAGLIADRLIGLS
jgi:protoheme IX farnesyltransferase